MTRVPRPFVAVLLTALLVVMPSWAASAHDELVGSDPADGATLDTGPDDLTLTFSGEISDLGAQVAVAGPDGQVALDDEPDVNGTEVEQELADDLPAGDYEVTWRVTSQDGHPISGTFAFTVTGSGDDAGSDDTASAEATAEQSDVDEPSETSPDATTAPTDDPGATSEPAQGEGGGGMPVWAWALVVAAVVGLLGLLARTWTRGRS